MNMTGLRAAPPNSNESARLAEFASGLRFDQIPQPVVDRTVDFFVDWFGSTLSGTGQRPIIAFQKYAATMGPTDGRSEVLLTGQGTSPQFAALINAAASHISEQDDVHNGSVFHPAAVTFPAALATAQLENASGKEFIAACVVGYEIGIRVGEFLGRSHYRVFHTTGTAGTIAAAVAVGRLLRLDAKQMLDAIGSAGTQAAGLWEFLKDAADSKQLHTAKAASDGLMAAFLARDGFTGAKRILEGKQGMAAGMSSDADPAKLVDGLGTRWAVLETSFKFHASCRHTHPAADALLQILVTHDLPPEEVHQVTCHVHQGALDVLGPVIDPVSVHQAKFSMPATLGLIAAHHRAGMEQFANYFSDDTARSFLNRVSMVLDPEVDGAYPRRWIGKVTVTTKGGIVHEGRVDEPKGDPGNTLSRSEINTKAVSLVRYGTHLQADAAEELVKGLWGIVSVDRIGFLR